MVDNGETEAVIATRVNKELSSLRYGQDESGQEVLIMASSDEEEEERQSLSSSSGRSISQQQHQKPYRGVTKTVMMAWEKGYMEALVQALDIKGGEDEVSLSNLLESIFIHSLGDLDLSLLCRSWRLVLVWLIQLLRSKRGPPNGMLSLNVMAQSCRKRENGPALDKR